MFLTCTTPPELADSVYPRASEPASSGRSRYPSFIGGVETFLSYLVVVPMDIPSVFEPEGCGFDNARCGGDLFPKEGENRAMFPKGQYLTPHPSRPDPRRKATTV